MPDPVAQPPDPTTVVACKPGEYLFLEGERHNSLFVIESGQIELLRAVNGGSRRLALLGAGDVLGEDATFGRRASGYSARAASECRVVRVPAGTFEAAVRVAPEVAARVIASIGRRLHEARLASVTAEAPDVVAAVAPVGPVAPARPPGTAEAAIAPRFMHVDTGSSFPLPAEGEAVVGRADPRTKFHPDIELSAVDTGRSLSRRHAVISRAEGCFLVTEQPRVANGTFVNGERLKPGDPKPIRDGDEVCFGLVRTLFRTT